MEARPVAVQSACAVCNGMTIVLLHCKEAVCKASIPLLTASLSLWTESRGRFIWQNGMMTEDQLCLVGPSDAYARSPTNCLAFTSDNALL